MPSKQEIYRQIEQELGFVPGFFKQLPADSLEHEWTLFAAQLDDDYGEIPPKERELAGIAVAAQMQCPYCAYAHTAFARLFGATDAEIEDAAHTAKHTAGWSSYLRGLDYDLDEFKREVDQACENMKKQM